MRQVFLAIFIFTLSAGCAMQPASEADDKGWVIGIALSGTYAGETPVPNDPSHVTGRCHLRVTHETSAWLYGDDKFTGKLLCEQYFNDAQFSWQGAIVAATSATTSLSNTVHLQMIGEAEAPSGELVLNRTALGSVVDLTPKLNGAPAWLAGVKLSAESESAAFVSTMSQRLAGQFLEEEMRDPLQSGPFDQCQDSVELTLARDGFFAGRNEQWKATLRCGETSLEQIFYLIGDLRQGEVELLPESSGRWDFGLIASKDRQDRIIVRLRVRDTSKGPFTRPVYDLTLSQNLP